VDPRVRNDVGLELGEVDVDCAVEPQRQHDLPDEAASVRVCTSGAQCRARGGRGRTAPRCRP
jgi:hypothetical protein